MDPWNILGYRMPLDGVLKVNINQSLGFENVLYLVVIAHHIASLEIHTIYSRQMGDSLFFHMTPLTH